MNPKRIGKSIEGYLDSKSIVVSSTAQILIDADIGMTARAIAELAGVKKQYVGDALRMFREDGFAYICEWRREGLHAMVALYVKGKGEDVQRDYKGKTKRYKTKEQEYLTVSAQKINELSARYIEINHALVPHRNMRQQRVVNQRYLEHVQGIR